MKHKTISVKILYRILRKIAENKTDELGDVTTSEDSGVITTLIKDRVA
ncbi:MAG: hypothetical protein HQK79_17690 [Desulfobacterales bacterium]|nr:hypothetical protein [Desulfobacterales bacterium]